MSDAPGVVSFVVAPRSRRSELYMFGNLYQTSHELLVPIIPSVSNSIAAGGRSMMFSFQPCNVCNPRKKIVLQRSRSARESAETKRISSLIDSNESHRGGE